MFFFSQFLKKIRGNIPEAEDISLPQVRDVVNRVGDASPCNTAINVWRRWNSRIHFELWFVWKFEKSLQTDKTGSKFCKNTWFSPMLPIRFGIAEDEPNLLSRFLDDFIQNALNVFSEICCYWQNIQIQHWQIWEKATVQIPFIRFAKWSARLQVSLYIGQGMSCTFRLNDKNIVRVSQPFSE